MLTGSRLGAALKIAMEAKRVTQKNVADEFGVAQSSVSEWTKFGRIKKAHINHLVAYFSDVARPSHWGLPDDWGNMPAATLEPMLGSAALKVAEQFQQLNTEQRNTILALLSVYQPIKGVESAAADEAALEPRPSPPPALPPPGERPRAKPSAKRAR